MKVATQASAIAQSAEYVQGRNSFLSGLRGGGALLTVKGSVHMSFTDTPSYMTSLGRSLLGGVAFGALSVPDMTSMTGDAISAFVGPALGVRNGETLDHVLTRHSAIRSERRFTPRLSR